ncbi:hypothetical protein A0H76_1631 [Hepatospora eriocheir]|uniref:Uncharacterized protein n=1 Tax=Hepatospora eriocheir TaxID=1081669 RepID=A0A1X0QH28_9MICR|nr:hypothetical protein A0H76_1631 [Hepatospora eriocheir]
MTQQDTGNSFFKYLKMIFCCKKIDNKKKVDNKISIREDDTCSESIANKNVSPSKNYIIGYPFDLKKYLKAHESIKNIKERSKIASINYKNDDGMNLSDKSTDDWSHNNVKVNGKNTGKITKNTSMGSRNNIKGMKNIIEAREKILNSIKDEDFRNFYIGMKDSNIMSNETTNVLTKNEVIDKKEEVDTLRERDYNAADNNLNLVNDNKEKIESFPNEETKEKLQNPITDRTYVFRDLVKLFKKLSNELEKRPVIKQFEPHQNKDTTNTSFNWRTTNNSKDETNQLPIYFIHTKDYQNRFLNTIYSRIKNHERDLKRQRLEAMGYDEFEAVLRAYKR